jgi:extracellular factor (EF) 3-hydroxypalmitic acid methyl ester biosynthesis protein
MRMIYQDDYQGGSSFGKLMHKHALGQSAAQAVRNRRQTVAGMIDDFVKSSRIPPERKIRVLSVACGPAAEVSDILQDKTACDRLHFSLLDQDQQALLEVARLVSSIEKRLRLQVSADFIRESVRTMLVSRQLRERWGRFDFIYSMGLFDYLTPPVAQAVLRKLFDLASPGGEMVIGNFSAENPSRVFMEYWMDWKIILRSPQSMRRLAEGLPGAEVDLVCDQTGIQMLMRIRKAGG